jgi:hypothetical protein
MSTTISKLTPVQKGVVSWKGNECVFEGKWAMTEDAYQKGETSAFYYAAKGAPPASREPFTGKYDGYFYMKTFAPEPVKVVESNVTLRFLVGAETGNSEDKVRVVGFGKNGYGAFELNGVYDSSDGSVILNKVYKVVQRKQNRTPAKKKKKVKTVNNVAPNLTKFLNTKQSKKVLLPFLRGTAVTSPDGVTSLTGTWAMNRTLHDKNDTSTFTYTFRSKSIPVADGKGEKEPDLGVSKIEIADSRRAVMSRLDGIYDGYFNVKTEGPEPLKIIENGLKFRLQDQRYNIEGSTNASMPKDSSQCTISGAGT